MITTNKKLLPELRFPEFSNQWIEEKTSYFLKRVNNPVNVSLDKEYREIGVRSHGKGIFHKKIIKGKELGDKRVFWVEVPAFLVNIVFAWEQAVAVTSLAEKGFIASHRFPMFVPNNQRADLNFVKYFFFRAHGKYLLELASPGGAGRNKTLGQSEFAKLKVIFPKIEEQQKIAAFLSAVDDKLTNLRRKCELLKNYKHGLMQQLFSQQVRFEQDDGSDFPDWGSAKLGNIFERVTNKNKENNKNVLTISAQQGLVSQEDYFNKSVSADDVRGYYLLEKNDFAYNKSYSKGYPMGAIKRLTKYDKGVVSTLYICFRAKNIDEAEFYEHYFNSGLQNKELHKIAQEGARNHGLLNLSVIEFFEDILLPRPELPEQRKIADFLQSIDNKIDAVAKQINQFDTFKKGLLQKLFV